MAEDILTTRPGSYQQDVLQGFLSLSIMVKWMTDARGRPYYMSGDIPTRCPAEFFRLFAMVKGI